MKNSRNTVFGHNINIGDGNNINQHSDKCDQLPRIKVNGVLKKNFFKKLPIDMDYEVQFELNEQCPICYRYGNIQFVWAIPKPQSNGCIAFFICNYCNQIFAVSYDDLELSQNVNVGWLCFGKPLISCDKTYTPYSPSYPALPKRLDIPAFSKFKTVYQELCMAKVYKIIGLTGMAYRKAIEFLIKDWLILESPENKKIIEKASLSTLITGKHSNEKIERILEDTALRQDIELNLLVDKSDILANDYTHYLNGHEDIPLSFLEELFECLLRMIDKKLLQKELMKISKK